ncbi:MAG: hypothetical protein IKG37_07275 [Solobacterium sp.]|nr:hypothetical protein [Solobacterium sp.]
MLLTIITWTAIIIGTYFVVKNVFSDKIIYWTMGVIMKLLICMMAATGRDSKVTKSLSNGKGDI